MITKTAGTTKREKIFLKFESENYKLERSATIEKLAPLNKAIEELETIIKKPIEDYKAFSKDILGYSIEQIKKTYPKPFDLGLDMDTTLKMLSIDMTNLKSYAEQFDVNTECVIEDGYSRNEINQDQFNKYCESPEQFDRYDFCLQIIDTIKKAVGHEPAFSLQGLAVNFRRFIDVGCDIAGNAKVSVRAEFVLTGN
ncbi:hypothetical protein [Flavobacterium sp. Arc2]|uniref:hypothetical protein n=1 Tax=Flavobacterium sp. Arc2 TaxID=3046685 RepID=UPI00352FEBFC